MTVEKIGFETFCEMVCPCDTRVLQVLQPVFIALDGNGYAVISRALESKDFASLVSSSCGCFYFYECTKLESGQYSLRYRVVEKDIAPLFGNSWVNQRTVLSNDLRPYRLFNAECDVEKIWGTMAAWGRPEVVRQLGELVMRQLEADRKRLLES